MGIGETLSKEIKAWGVLAIIVVIVSVILLKFKTSNVICTTAGSSVFHETNNICCLSATNCTTNSTPGLISTLDTFVSAFSEPKNWVSIVIIALIGFAILYMFTKKSEGKD